MGASKVVLVRGERGHQPVQKALELVGYDRVLLNCSSTLIKVNFITTKTWDTGATTDPIVVEAIIKSLQERSIRPIVVESDATLTNADEAFKVTGMAEMCERNGVEWLNLRHVKGVTTIGVPGGEALESITVPSLVAESAVISAAKLKTHVSTKVTLGMKNMFGLLPDKLKMKYHAKGISNVIVDINKVLRPRLTVIDGFIAMEGNGPSNGSPVKMGLIIVGEDPVATDATACRVMGIDPYEVSHIRKAYEIGLGNIENIQVIGERLEDVTRVFRR